MAKEVAFSREEIPTWGGQSSRPRAAVGSGSGWQARYRSKTHQENAARRVLTTCGNTSWTHPPPRSRTREPVSFYFHGLLSRVAFEVFWTEAVANQQSGVSVCLASWARRCDRWPRKASGSQALTCDRDFQQDRFESWTQMQDSYRHSFSSQEPGTISLHVQLGRMTFAKILHETLLLRSRRG